MFGILVSHFSIKESQTDVFCLVGGNVSRVFVSPAQAPVFLRVNIFEVHPTLAHVALLEKPRPDTNGIVVLYILAFTAKI